MSNYEDLRGAAANEEIILDDQGIPSVMVKVPLVYLDELGIGSAHTPHPAFIINDKVVPYIYVSKYINVIKNNRAYSIPNQDPANCITFDRAVEVCYNKGAGVLTQIKDNFRVYDSLEEGVKGYFDFISASRYANLKGVTDPKTYIENIKADGYATSSQYVKNLLNLVSAYNLTQHDNITAQQGKKSVAEIAQEVIAGAWGNGTERKEKLEAAGYNYAEVQAIVNERAGNKTENKVDNKKSIAEIAQEVVAGKWGNGSERKQRLEAEGYDYAEVQATVNNIMGKSQPNKKNVAEIANEVISGKWGNGSERKEKLEAAGYNYAEVQAKVNEMLR